MNSNRHICQTLSDSSCIDVTDMGTWSQEILEYCQKNILQYSSIDDVPCECFEHLNSLCQHCNIIAYHYTKEPCAGYYKANGLRCLDFDTHIAEFWKNHGTHFTPEEQNKMNQVLQSDGKKHQDEGLLHFVYDRIDSDSGVSDFITYYGGEAIYWYFANDTNILGKLKNIGCEVVVKFRLPFATIRPSLVAETMVKWYMTRNNLIK